MGGWSLWVGVNVLLSKGQKEAAPLPNLRYVRGTLREKEQL